jgi:hypothetical protein
MTHKTIEIESHIKIKDFLSNLTIFTIYFNSIVILFIILVYWVHLMV